MKPYTKYLIKRAILLAITLVIATYLTVVIANLGGYVDKILKSQIEMNVAQQLQRNPNFQALPPEKQQEILKRKVDAAIRAAGLNTPYWERSIIYLEKALSLDLGRAMFLHSASGSSHVRDIIFERLPWTVYLFTTGTVISAILGIWLGLNMGRKALTTFDRGLSMYAIVSQSIPPWFLGILFILLFAFQLRIFPPGGIVSRPHTTWTGFTLDFLHHLALPLITWVVVGFGYWAYVTRNLVIHILGEDYVMAARARGLPERVVIRRYVLRPASPPIVTMTALALIASWMGAIITETVFSWRGLGMLYYEAVWSMDAPVIIGLTVMYAYLLVITVFILDIIYGILDPRVKTGGVY